jgi:hypothetical protein
MAKFIVVKEAPTELKKGEYVIDKPNFLKEIEMHKTKNPKNGLTGSFQLRMILDSIAQNYDPENMTAYSVKVHKFEGRPFTDNESLNNIVVEMLQADYPAIFPKYLENKIKNRPSKTELVYYVDSGIKGAYEIFYRNGFDDSKPEVVKEKSTKVVGKPAITKEQAEALKNQADS